MEALSKYRRAGRQQIGRTLVTDPNGSRMFHLQKEGDPKVAEILAQPEKALAPIQYHDPADPNFKKFKFMAGYDPVDGGDSVYE